MTITENKKLMITDKSLESYIIRDSVWNADKQEYGTKYDIMRYEALESLVTEVLSPKYDVSYIDYIKAIDGDTICVTLYINV